MCEQVHSFKNGEAVLQPGHNLKDTLFVLLKGELAGSQIFKVF